MVTMDTHAHPAYFSPFRPGTSFPAKPPSTSTAVSFFSVAVEYRIFVSGVTSKDTAVRFGWMFSSARSSDGARPPRAGLSPARATPTLRGGLTTRRGDGGQADRGQGQDEDEHAHGRYLPWGSSGTRARLKAGLPGSGVPGVSGSEAKMCDPNVSADDRWGWGRVARGGRAGWPVWSR